MPEVNISGQTFADLVGGFCCKAGALITHVLPVGGRLILRTSKDKCGYSPDASLTTHHVKHTFYANGCLTSPSHPKYKGRLIHA